MGGIESSAHLRKLLQAYDAIAWHPVPRVVFMGRFIWLPRPSWFTRYFVVQHIRRRLDELERRLSARAALTDNHAGSARDLEIVAAFRRSLPPTVSRRVLILLTIAAILVLTRLASQWLFDLSTPNDRTEMKLLIELEDSLLSLNLRGGVVDAIAAAPVVVLFDLLSGLVFFTYLVLRFAYPGFRLKRVMFNGYPALPKGRKWGRMRKHVSVATGLYELEADVFKTLETAKTREFPFDLAVSALLVGLWTGVGVALLGPSADEDLAVGVVMLATGLPWFAWLARAWWRRQRRGRRDREAAEPAVLQPS